MDWSQHARETIQKVHASLPENATLDERKKALFDAYPFGDRAMWPYKAWNKAKREYLAKFDQSIPKPKHLSPLERQMARAGVR